MDADNPKLRHIDRLSSQLYRVVSEMVKDRVTGGVTLSQLMVLRQIALGRDNVSEIASRLRISAPAVSKMTHTLVREGFIERRDDQKDRRLIHLVLNRKGREAVKANEKIRREMMCELLKTTTDEEIEKIISLLETLLERFSSVHDFG